MNNGRAQAQISEAEWASTQRQLTHHDRRIEGLEDIVPDLGSLMGEIGRNRAATEKTADHLLQLDSAVKMMGRKIDELLGWKEDSKVQRISDLVGQVNELEREKEKQREIDDRDALDRRRTIFASLLTFITTVAGAVAVHLITRGGH